MTDAVEKVGDPAALAAKTATPTIPIAFVISGDQSVARSFERTLRLVFQRAPSLPPPSVDRFVRNRSTRLADLPGDPPAARVSHVLFQAHSSVLDRSFSPKTI
jgi:hypothetical protein